MNGIYYTGTFLDGTSQNENTGDQNVNDGNKYEYYHSAGLFDDMTFGINGI